MKMIPFKAVLFDHDGVLVASERLHWKAWGMLLNEIGLPYDEPLIQSKVGKPAPVILSEVLDVYKKGWSRTDYDLDALSVRKNEFYAALIPTDLKVYPGIRELLKYLNEKKIPAGVVSNARTRELRYALDTLKLSHHFQVILSRDDVPAPKPDPRAYGFGAEKLGVAPADCIILDDSPTGLASSLRLGAITAAILTNFSEQQIRSDLAGDITQPERFYFFQDPLAFFQALQN